MLIATSQENTMIRKNRALACVLALTTLSYVTLAAAGAAPMSGGAPYALQQVAHGAAAGPIPAMHRVRCAGVAGAYGGESERHE